MPEELIKNFSDYIVIYEEPWQKVYDETSQEQEIVSGRYLVAKRKVTLVTHSIIRSGIQQFIIYDVGEIKPMIIVPGQVISHTKVMEHNLRRNNTIDLFENSKVDEFFGMVTRAAFDPLKQLAPVLLRIKGKDAYMSEEEIEMLEKDMYTNLIDQSNTDIANPFTGLIDALFKKTQETGEISIKKLPPSIRPHGGTIILKGDTGDFFIQNQKGLNVLHARSNHDTHGGQLYLKDNSGKTTVELNGQDGKFHLKNKRGETVFHARIDRKGYGYLSIKDQAGKDTIRFNGGLGNISAGGEGQDGNIYLKNANDDITIHLDGKEGDIILSNADCAEEFDIVEKNGDIDPGSVMVLNESGQLTISADAYDKKVAGIISGAGDYKPGIVLDRQPSQHKRLPVALMGKVFCKVDATFGAIEVGDLLTTSPTAGHAMKANDPFKAFGTVIGKALRGITEGQGLIPVLVGLQ